MKVWNLDLTINLVTYVSQRLAIRICLHMYACMHTVLCFGLCLPHIKCSVNPENSAELSFLTDIETQSKTSCLFSFFLFFSQSP